MLGCPKIGDPEVVPRNSTNSKTKDEAVVPPLPKGWDFGRPCSGEGGARDREEGWPGGKIRDEFVRVEPEFGWLVAGGSFLVAP